VAGEPDQARDANSISCPNCGTAYASFWQDAAAQYVSQAGHAAEVNSHSAIGLVDELRSETEAAGSTVPLRKTA
jgi:hypothetical protein